MAARWQHPTLFCSDINLRTLIDITPFDEEHLLITCKSFVKRFSLTDRKQVNSWIAKSWDPFTCGAVKDPKTNKIYAVVNQTDLYHWHVEEKYVQNFKKCLFKSRIHSLVSNSDSLFIIYDFGYIQSLEDSLKERKVVKPHLLKENDCMLQSHIFSKTKKALLLVRSQVGDINLYRIKISTTNFSYFTVKLSDYQLTGSLFLSSGNLLTTWSDGYLYSLLPTSKRSDPGDKIGRLSHIKENKKIKILCLSEHHLAFQGMNINEEGGVLVLYDAKFGVSVSVKPLKMYRNPPLAWNVPFGIVVGDGGSLLYVPVLLSPSTVGSMLGSHRNGDSIFDECVGWGISNEENSEKVREMPFSAVLTTLSNKSKKLSKIIIDLKLGSVSEDIVVDEVVSKIIENNNLELLTEVLSSFNFISEKCLVCVLKFLIELHEDINPSDEMNNKRVKTTSILSNCVPEENHHEITNGFDDDSNESVCMEMDIDGDNKNDTQLKEESLCLFSNQRSQLINQILRKPISVNEVMKEIVVLGFGNSIRLVKYLHYLLTSGISQLFPKENNEVPTVENICTWLTILFDANYQQFVMTADVEIYRIHMKIFSYAKSILEFWHSTFNVEVLVNGISASNLMPTETVNSPYSIEKITLL